MGQLADEVILSKSGVTRLIDRLVGDGLVERERLPGRRPRRRGRPHRARPGRLRAASRTHLRGHQRALPGGRRPDDLEAIERSMTAVARRAGPGRATRALCSDDVEPGSRRRATRRAADRSCRAGCTPARAASPTRAGRRGSTRPGLRGVRLLRHYAAAAAGGRAEQHLLRISRRRPRSPRWVAATPADFRFSSRPSAAARSGRSQVDPADGVPWLTGPYRAFGERLGTVLFRVPDGVRRDDAKLAALLAAWPRDLPLTMEFQDPSWHVDETFEALAGRGRRAVRHRAARRRRAADHPPDRAVPVPAAAPPRLRRPTSSRPGRRGSSRSWPPATTCSCSSATTRSGAARSSPSRSRRAVDRVSAPPGLRGRRSAARSPSAGPNTTRSTSRSVMSWNRCGTPRPRTRATRHDRARPRRRRVTAPGPRRRSTARPRCGATAGRSRRPRGRRARPTGPAPSGTRGRAGRRPHRVGLDVVQLPGIHRSLPRSSGDSVGRSGATPPVAGTSRVDATLPAPHPGRIAGCSSSLRSPSRRCSSPSRRRRRLADARPAAVRPSPATGGLRPSTRRGVVPGRGTVGRRRADWRRSTWPTPATAAAGCSSSSRRGRIRIVRGRRARRRARSSTSRAGSRSGGERGLLGLAFHPDYPADPRFFVDYTDRRRRHGRLVVRRVGRRRRTRPTPTASRSSSTSTSRSPTTTAAGSRSGRTACSTSRWATAARAATRRATASASTRCWPRSCASTWTAHPTADAVRHPGRQPVRRRPAGAEPEIWLTGLRNPWRIRFDRATGDLWIGDVGQGAWEEIDVARAGAERPRLRLEPDGGLPLLQPRRLRPDGLTLPVAEYGHDLGCAVIGGVVVRDRAPGSLDGGYLFGDCVLGQPVADGPGRRRPARAGRRRADWAVDQRDRRRRGRRPSTRRAWVGRAAADRRRPRRLTDRPVRRSGR